MATQDIFEDFVKQRRREGRNEGRTEGREAGLAEAVLEVYAERFGPPPAEVSTLVQQIHDSLVLRGWLKLVARATADDVLRAMKG